MPKILGYPAFRQYTGFHYSDATFATSLRNNCEFPVVQTQPGGDWNTLEFDTEALDRWAAANPRYDEYFSRDFVRRVAEAYRTAADVTRDVARLAPSEVRNWPRNKFIIDPGAELETFAKGRLV